MEAMSKNWNPSRVRGQWDKNLQKEVAGYSMRLNELDQQPGPQRLRPAQVLGAEL